MATLDEVLQACVDQPLEKILSLASTCSHYRCEREMSYVAARNDRADLLDYLVRNSPTGLEPRGMVLLDCAGGHSKSCTQLMLDQGLDINLVDDRFGGVLHRALGRVGCPEDYLTWLIERGALVNNPHDNTNQVHCLCRAVSHGTIPIMKLLVAAGADVDFSRALHYAAWCGYLDKAKYLVEEAGATVDMPNGFDAAGYVSYWYGDADCTPLHVAAAANHVDVAEYLLDKGADIGAKNAAGRTPLEDAEYLAALAATEPRPEWRRLPQDLRWVFGSFYEGHAEILAFLRARVARRE